MRTNRSLFPLLVIIIGILPFYIGCSKSQLNNANFTLYDHTAAEEAYNDMFRLVCQKGDPFAVSYTDTCYTVVVTGDSTSKTYAFSFVNECTDNYGSKRKGSMSITFTHDFANQGSVATVTPGSDYYYNDSHIQGVMTVTNTGFDAAGRVVYEMVVSGANITNANAQSYTWQCDRTMIRSFHQLVFSDIYHIKGTASGIDHNGHSFSASIDDSLQKQITCKWPFMGNLTMVITTLDNKYVKYGQSGCNDSTCCNNTVFVRTGSSGSNSVLLN